MATANNTIKTRIQLKSDTEANWNKAGPKDGSPGFIPLAGELIIYSADNAHPFSRLKIGDGQTNVINLPFIDSGTLNGTEVEIVKKATDEEFPLAGSEDKLYVDLSTNRIFHYTNASGYTQLSNFNYKVTKIAVENITGWSSGRPTEISISDNTLKIKYGVAPTLTKELVPVISNIEKEVVKPHAE